MADDKGSAELTRLIGEEQLRPGRLSVAPGARSDARRAERNPSNSQMTLLLESQGRKIRQDISTVDMSLLGVRIRLVGDLRPGQRVALIPAERAYNIYPCRVVWVSPPGPQLSSEAGLEFWAIAKLAPGS